MTTTPPPEIERAVLERDGQRERGEVRFRCPYPARHTHADANPSARYHPERGVWWCDVCQEGGGWSNLCDLLGLTRERDSEIDTAYSYTDENGTPLFQVVRKTPKGFVQRRPDGNGDWIWNTRGVRKVLYRLPEVVAAVDEGRTVHLVEGEKDTDTLAGLGLAATTNPGGAGRWTEDYTNALRGARVVILPDNDTAGREHALKVARALDGVAAEVRVVELPDLPEGGDVSDWIAARRRAGAGDEETRRRLEETVSATPPWDPDQDPADQHDGADEPSGKNRQPTQSELLIRRADERGVEPFHTPDRDAFALLPVDGHHETWRIHSKTFKHWLLHGYFTLTGKAPSAQALTDARNTLVARALFEGDERQVHTRVTGTEDAVYLDLGNNAWEAVEITGGGWRVVSDPPVRFRRSPAMLPLPRPVPGGSIEELRPLVNLPDDDSFVLFVAFLVGALHPVGPYPALVLHGEQGSAKSTLARFARALIDPASAPLRTTPRNEQDLMISASHGWMLAFDNLSTLPNWLSDAFCRLATGGGFSARELYTDSGEVIFSATRPVLLNGIDEVVGRQDLLDRSIVTSLPAIPDHQRRREDKVWKEFEALRPRLLGSLLDAVSCALRRQSEVRLERSPRMADFAHWVVAAEAALPWPEGSFLAAYEGNRQESVEISLEADPVATAVRSLVMRHGTFEGTSQELLERLEAEVSETTRRSRSWPGSARGLSSRLKRAAPTLRQAGIECIRGLREPGTGRRLIRLVQTEAATDRHNRHNRHEAPGEGVSGRDANASAVTVTSRDRHSGESPGSGVCDGRDGCDGSIPTSSEPATVDDEELRL